MNWDAQRRTKRKERTRTFDSAWKHVAIVTWDEHGSVCVRVCVCVCVCVCVSENTVLVTYPCAIGLYHQGTTKAWMHVRKCACGRSCSRAGGEESGSSYPFIITGAPREHKSRELMVFV